MPLDAQTLKKISQRARRSEVLARGLAVRSLIVESLGSRQGSQARLLGRVDTALRKLNAQDELRARLREAVASAGTSPPAVDESVEAFEAREVMLARLVEQEKELLEEGERVVVELENLHLALLDATASEAILDSGRLGEALNEVETRGASARRQREAEAEVARFLAASNKSD